VIDLTSMVSGPLATMTLADQGAEVIKIEHPAGGDHTRKVAGRRGGVAASYLNNNRNKRSVTLNLKDPRGVEAVMRLAATADVLVQNFRPGVAERLGLGEGAVRAASPNIVYVSIAGFGFEGPYAQKPVYDPLVQALSGLTTVQAASDQVRPRLIRTILPDKLTGIQAAQAITAALLARARTGEGQHVRLSMLDTVVAFLWSSDMTGHTFVGDETVEEAQSFADLIYATSDGYMSVSAMSDKDWRALAMAVGRHDWLEDPRFLTPALRDANKEARLALTQSVLETRTTAEWLAIMEAHDVPCAPVLTRAEVVAHPQIAANGSLQEYDHPVAGRLRQARHPAQFSATPPDAPRAAPALGQDTQAVLAEAGYSESQIEALIADGVATQPAEAAETGT